MVNKTVTVIGAGVSGLAISTLLAARGHHVLCLESHALPGGCAGFFKRKGVSFDVGATTLSGLSDNGPIKKFADLTDCKFHVKRADPGIVVHTELGAITRSADQTIWASDIFPSQFNSMFEKIDKISNLAWALVDQSKHFPPRNGRDLYELIGKNSLSKLKILPYLIRSFDKMFIDIPLTDLQKTFLNELLLIAAQNFIDKTPALVGAMALSYTKDCWYPVGGMEGFVRSIESRFKQLGGEISYRNSVLKISKGEKGLRIQTQNELIDSELVVSTIPIWNTLKLLDPSIKAKELRKQALRHRAKWGAVVGHYQLSFRQPEKRIYHQVHLDAPLVDCYAHSLFISLSHPEDSSRTRNQTQTATISTHIDLDLFNFKVQKNNYTELRSLWDSSIQSELKKIFGENLLNIELVGIGDPHTYQRYTGRFGGTVGGLVQDINFNLLTFPQSQTGTPNLYQIGDTTFPGQGIVGVVQGALNLSHLINGA